MKPTILVIDDEPAICYAFERFLSARGYRVASVATAAAGLETAQRLRPDLVFLDLCLPDGNGLDTLETLRTRSPDLRVVIITAFGSLDAVLGAVAGQAFDYLAKPLDLDRVAEVVRRAEAARSATAGPAPGAEDAASEPGEEGPQSAFVGRSAAIQDVFKQVAKVAPADTGVLLLGETGTGKELLAHTIHRLSRRAEGPFVAVNCGALPENLVESELFGHVKGAFTGATADRPGRLEQAAGGTLLLDEVGDLPPSAQVKLLRFLDSRQVERVGDAQTRTLDVRVLAATNCELRRAVDLGRFRSDLFYRLSVVQITLPLLRERREDIPLLARHFLRRFAGADCPVPVLTAATLERLQAWPWPGNIRELRNALEHAWLLAAGEPLLPEHLPEPLRAGAGATAAAADGLRAWVRGLAEEPDMAGRLYEAAVRALEQELFRLALERSGGNQSAAAEYLGVHRNTLARKRSDLADGAEGEPR